MTGTGRGKHAMPKGKTSAQLPWWIAALSHIQGWQQQQFGCVLFCVWFLFFFPGSGIGSGFLASFALLIHNLIGIC